MGVDLRRDRVRIGWEDTLRLESVLVQEELGWVLTVVLSRVQHKMAADRFVGDKFAAGGSTMLRRGLLAVAGRMVRWE